MINNIRIVEMPDGTQKFQFKKQTQVFDLGFIAHDWQDIPTVKFEDAYPDPENKDLLNKVKGN